MNDEAEAYEAPEERKLQWLTWLEQVVDFATTNHDTELLVAVVGGDYVHMERLLYKRLRQYKKRLREVFGLESIAAYEATLQAQEAPVLYERWLQEAEWMFAFVRAVKSGVKRTHRTRILSEFSYTRLLEWKKVQACYAR